MFASMKSQRTSLVPLFKLTDFVAKVKKHVDETLEISGAVVVPDDNPEDGFTGWGEEDVPSVFKPLMVPPQVPIQAEVDELDLSDLEGLDPEMARVIQEKARAMAAKNRKHARRALTTYQGLFQQMYGSLSTLANITSNSVCVYLKLFSVADANQ